MSHLIKSDSAKGKKISFQAKAVAKDVVEKVSKGEKISMYKILRDHGYSHWYAKQSSRVINTNSFQEEINSIIEPMREVRVWAIAAILEQVQNFNRLSVTDLANVASKMTHDILLLGGTDGGSANKQAVKDLTEIGDILKEFRKSA